MARGFLAAGLALAFCASASAHEMWLDPLKFRLDAPGAIPVRFLVGDGADIEPWAVLKTRVTSLRTYGPSGAVDHKASLREGQAAGGATVTFTEPGAHILAMESAHSFVELPAADFDAYVKDEGIAPIAKDRSTPAAQAKPGREMYSRRAKSLVRVGEGEDDIFLRPIGMTLEIVPEKCPYHLENGDRLPLRVYFHGAPLAGATVHMIRQDRPADPAAEAITDAQGRASFALPRAGKWLVGVIWSDPLSDRTRADYDTTFSSLTFGF